MLLFEWCMLTYRFLYRLRLRDGGVNHPRHRFGNNSTNGIARHGRSCIGIGMLFIMLFIVYDVCSC